MLPAADSRIRLLAEVRDRTLELVAGLDADVLHQPLDPIMSPLVWDLAHIAAYEDLWCVHRAGGEPLLREDLMDVYDAFETPRAARAETQLLGYEDALAYLRAVRQRTLSVLERVDWSDTHEMVLRHELQHAETMRQALFLGGLPGGAPDRLPRFPAEAEFIAVPGGPVLLGATGEGFAYDNERPRHRVDLPAFRIARTPVTNATWMRFAEGGGYERREWWGAEGWSWKQCYDITHPEGSPGHPDEPVMHVSWFEADAFARSQGGRLPTEAEWERAATWDQDVLDGPGCVWEWTSSEFTGYPGFRAYPYREYSEVFFDVGYRVLRGGSWASHPLVTTPTFRNWDLPQRRQIFSGVRLVMAVE